MPSTPSANASAPPSPGLSAMLARTDVMRHRGRLALINRADSSAALTPHGAMVADLLAVREVLDACGIEYLLVRGNDQRPVLAIDTSLRPTLERALATAFAGNLSMPAALTPKNPPSSSPMAPWDAPAKHEFSGFSGPGSSPAAACTTAQRGACRLNCGHSPARRLNCPRRTQSPGAS